MDSRLSWIQRNRTRSDPTRSIGRVVHGVAREVETRTAEAHRRANLIAAVLKGAWHDHVRVEVDDAGQTMINVDQAGMIFELKDRFLKSMQSAVSGRSRAPILFRVGVMGVRLPSTEHVAKANRS
jgi:hypothetical protein